MNSPKVYLAVLQGMLEPLMHHTAFPRFWKPSILVFANLDPETTLSLFRDNGKTVPGLINGTQAVFFDTRQVAKILRPKSFFVKK